MENYAYIIIDFISINTALLKNNALYFTCPQTKHYLSNVTVCQLPSCLVLIAEACKYHSTLVCLHYNKWLKNISILFILWYSNNFTQWLPNKCWPLNVVLLNTGKQFDCSCLVSVYHFYSWIVNDCYSAKTLKPSNFCFCNMFSVTVLL